MSLLNYSTQVDVSKSVAEINEVLVKHGARSILTDMDEKGEVVSISFKVQLPRGEVAFRLPANPESVMKIINLQTTKYKLSGGIYRKKVPVVPRSYYNDMSQARRVAWRILKDWVEAQMALIEVGMVQLHQVFLPYAIMKDGQTVFEMIESKGLLLEHKS